MTARGERTSGPVVPGADPAAVAWLLDACAPVAHRFERAGFSVFAVGGIVRDLAVGRDVRAADLDLTTDARPADTLALLEGWADALWRQGERFGTVGARVGGHDLEITTFRADAYEPASRKPVVTFGDTLEGDLARRDFTVNAMALDLRAERLVDPYGGLADLRSARLRTPLAPEVSFSDDPLRMLRAARLAAGYGLRPDDALVAAATAIASRLSIVSVERVHDELRKLLALPDPSEGLRFLAATGLAAECLPELGVATPAAREHAIAVVAAAPDDPLVRLVALVLALDGVRPGPAPTRGAEARVAARVRALRSSRDDIGRARRLASAAVAAADAPLVGRPLREAVLAAQGDRPVVVGLLEALGRADAARAFAALAAAEPDLCGGDAGLLAAAGVDGESVMARLDLAPGPLVGGALAAVRDARLTRGPLTAAEVGEVLDDWAATHAAGA